MSETPGALDAYFTRIGYGGLRAPTLAALRAIVLAHATAIPFENLDVLLGRGARLDGPALADKLVLGRRGGYCFEHNLLLLSVLRRLGFRAQGLAARVIWGRPAGSVGPRTHMLIEIDLPEGPHLADVGFGGLTPTAPLALAPGSAQTTPHETFRLVAAEDGFALEALRGEDWQSLYRFTREAQAPIDYEVANWFTATHPQSPFTHHLIAARPGPGCRYTLFDDKFAIRRLDGISERRRIRDAADLGAVLAEPFRIAVAPNELAALAARVRGSGHPDPFEDGRKDC